MIVCATCETNTDTLVCEECGALFCMDCYRRYEWRETSRLCWECQNEADQEWADTIMSAGPPAKRRTGPRLSPEENRAVAEDYLKRIRAKLRRGEDENC